MSARFSPMVVPEVRRCSSEGTQILVPRTNGSRSQTLWRYLPAASRNPFSAPPQAIASSAIA
jgi:hypothetical protein